MTGPLL